MNYFSLLTYPLAVAAGWMLLPLANQEDSGTLSAQNPSSQHRSTSPRFRSHSSPKRLLTALSHTEMEPSLRKDTKEKIYRDWADRNPVGLLEYLDGRVWIDCVNNAFVNLAQSQPEYLLDYARQHGCLKALHELSVHGDPNVILNLYLAQNPDTIPVSEFKTLFKNALRSDPQFHLNIDRLTSTGARTGAFTATAEIWLELGLYDTYFARLEELHGSLQLDIITHDFCYHILTNHEDVNLLHLLPEKARDRAIEETIEGMTQFSPWDQSYQRASLSAYLENGWLDNHIKHAQNTIQAQANHKESDNSHLADAIAWKDWGLTLPDDDKWEPLRHTAIRRWIVGDPTQWKTIIHLPTQGLRDIAYTAALSVIDLGTEDHAMPWIADQIKDPELNGVAIRVISERQNPRSDPDDPFAISLDVDPFDPFAKNDPNSDPFDVDQ